MIRSRIIRFPRTIEALALFAVLTLGATLAVGQRAPSVAGTYHIDSWQNLEARGLYHFFYLDPGGRFYLAGEWAGSESSRFGGTWSIAGDQLLLTGTADVNTNQGHWTIPYHRTFRMDRSRGVLQLTPLPEKNRFGLMGWPNTFIYAQPGVAMNLPGGKLPTDPKQLVNLSEALTPKP